MVVRAKVHINSKKGLNLVPFLPITARVTGIIRFFADAMNDESAPYNPTVGDNL